MVIVYSASNGFNAHIIKGLLAQHHIPAFVHGEYLQGGIGELPSTNDIVKVVVDNEYQAKALAVIKAWQDSPLIDDPNLAD